MVLLNCGKTGLVANRKWYLKLRVLTVNCTVSGVREVAVFIGIFGGGIHCGMWQDFGFRISY